MKRARVGMAISLALVTVSGGQTVDGEWTVMAYMPSERQEISAAVLNGKIYVIAGYEGINPPRSTTTVDVLNPATNTWASAADLPSANNHNGAAVAAGKLYAFGGIGRATYLYDPVNNSWSNVALSLYGHAETPAVGVIDDKIYVVGGVSAGTAMEVFDPATNAWTARASMSVARNHCTGGVINGKFYVAGGRGTPAAPTALEVYDPQTNSWTTLPSMPTPRSGIAAGVVNGELYVFGGEGGGVHEEVEIYNPISNSWRRAAPDMPAPRHGIWGATIGNRIYLPAGAGDEGLFPTGHTDAFVVAIKATFANISTRLKVETGENALIGGFIVTGAGSKRIIVRAIGPSLPIAGALANPRLELYNGTGQLVAVNDNWQDAPNKQEIIDTFIPPSNDLESAILTTVAPGNHTAVVRGVNDSTGVALVEVYDLEAGSDSRLANISTRGFVQTDDNVLIGGLILHGQHPRKVIVRAIGPSLPLSGALADPTLELRDNNGGLLASNNNWRSTQEAEIIATTIPPSHDLESAIVQTLAPANYTAIVRGQDAATGVALVEAYALD